MAPYGGGRDYITDKKLNNSKADTTKFHYSYVDVALLLLLILLPLASFLIFYVYGQ